MKESLPLARSHQTMPSCYHPCTRIRCKVGRTLMAPSDGKRIHSHLEDISWLEINSAHPGLLGFCLVFTNKAGMTRKRRECSLASERQERRAANQELLLPSKGKLSTAHSHYLFRRTKPTPSKSFSEQCGASHSAPPRPIDSSPS